MTIRYWMNVTQLFCTLGGHATCHSANSFFLFTLSGFRRRTFHEPNLIHWIKYMKSSVSESVRNACFNLACVAWRFWLGELSNKGGRGQRNREEIGAEATWTTPLLRPAGQNRHATQASFNLERSAVLYAWPGREFRLWSDFETAYIQTPNFSCTEPNVT